MRPLTGMLIGAGVAVAALAAPAWAQQRCPEGRAMSGECVNPGLAVAARKSVLAFTQPKYSYTAPAHLPMEDRDYPYPIARQWHEMLNLFYYPPISIPAGTTVKP